MKTLLLLAALALSACGKEDSKDTESVSDAFDRKNTLYTELQLDTVVTCDWTLFRSIQDAVRRLFGVVETAEGEAGKWYRTPGREQACFVAGQDRGSKSEISRDMLLGLALYLWQKGDVENAAEVVAYAEAHSGVMGAGDIFRTDIRPGLLSTFMGIEARAGDSGFPLPPRVENPDPETNEIPSLTSESADALYVQTGYRAHLTVVHIFLRGLVWGYVSDIELLVLKAQTERQPRNALFQAIYHRFLDGDQTVATRLLLDETLFPKDALPTSANYCTDYLWQRDDGAGDWAPCPAEGLAHTGVDWLFAAAVVRNGFRQFGVSVTAQSAALSSLSRWE